MIFDKIFWLWFVSAGLISIYLLFHDSSPYAIIFPVFLIGIGISKLSEESGAKKRTRQTSIKINRNLLDKLEGK